MICFLLLMTGCALDAYRMHPEFDARVGSIQESVLITPDVSMYEVSSGGVVMLRDDWSRVGRKNLQNAILREFKDKQYNVILVEMDTQTANEMAKVQTLYRLVHKTMQRHTLDSHHSSSNNRSFKYSLGSIELILNKLGADSLIFVSGYDRVSKAGRKALIDLAIADSTGTILYYSVKGSMQGDDLRNPESATSMVQELLASFSRTEE